MFKGVQSDLKVLNKFMDFYIITHRDWYPDSRNDTHYRLWLDSIPHEQIIFSRDKDKWAKLLDVDFFIEDVLDNANVIALNSDAKVFLLEREYNQGPTTKNVERIKSLKDIRW
jgi:uncharacterized HAD superfamily protein